MNMRIHDEVPVIGQIWLWDIDEILERQTNDMQSNAEEMLCEECSRYGCVEHPLSIEEQWDAILEERRSDRWYEAVQKSIADYGFTVPLTARLTQGVVALGDGHHRLAAAIDAGMTEVPVIMASQYSFVSQDSCAWADEVEYDPIDGEPILPPPPEHITARDGTLIYGTAPEPELA